MKKLISVTITLHEKIDEYGQKIKYARILKICDCFVSQQSVLIERLNQKQLDKAVLVYG